jgi:hypothetical protein
VSDASPDRPDPRERPPDPAGTRPRHEPNELLPQVRDPLIARATAGLPAPAAVGAHSDVGLPAEPIAAGPSEHSPRFQFLMGALAAIGVAAVAMMAAIAFNGGSTRVDGPAWSPWHPASRGGDGAAEVAAHVGRRYRLPDGHQLVAVQGGPLVVADLPVTVALRESADRGGDIKLINGNGVLYRLCGLGEKCSIPYGKPSKERHLLLRREALELALYSFRYLGVEDVAVLMPPPPGQDANLALFFRRDDVQGVIDKPLQAVLPTPVPTLAKVVTSPNAGFINRLTYKTLFTFSLTQITLDNRALLVLDRFTGDSATTGSGSSSDSKSSGSTKTKTGGASKGG